MMNERDYGKRLDELRRLAINEGLVKNKGEFAEMIGSKMSTISEAIKTGKSAGRLVRETEGVLFSRGINVHGEGNGISDQLARIEVLLDSIVTILEYRLPIPLMDERDQSKPIEYIYKKPKK